VNPHGLDVMKPFLLIKSVVACCALLAAGNQNDAIQEDAPVHTEIDLVTGAMFPDEDESGPFPSRKLRGIGRAMEVLVKLTPIELAVMWVYTYKLEQEASSAKLRQQQEMDEKVAKQVQEEKQDKSVRSTKSVLKLEAAPKQDSMKLGLISMVILLSIVNLKMCLRRTRRPEPPQLVHTK